MVCLFCFGELCDEGKPSCCDFCNVALKQYERLRPNGMASLLQHVAGPGDRNVIAALKELSEVGNESCGVRVSACRAMQSLIADRPHLYVEPSPKRSKCELNVG